MQAMTEAAPGRSVTYEFKARYAGIYLYHCGTPPVLEHLTNGMSGAVIIDPPHLPAVSKEFLVVQSELYLGPQRQPGDYAMMLRGQPDTVAFNSYYDQYMHAPLHVTAGQRVRCGYSTPGPPATVRSTSSARSSPRSSATARTCCNPGTRPAARPRRSA
jgi:nitrite reductase (NO-forming)